MVQRLKQQLSDGIQWVGEQAKANPLGLLVVAVFAIWFIMTLWITIRADRLGFDGKTFWEWMQLLIVPLVLALGALWFNASQKRTEIAIAEKNQQQATLEAYYDRMADLLLNHNLQNTEDRDQERGIARARTLAVLRSLDPERKAQVLMFLYGSGLIKKGKPIVNLSEADLSGIELRSVILNGIDLSGAEMQQANLLFATLRISNLSRVNLSESKLNAARLVQVNLSRAALVMADLNGASLSGADLSGAFLDEANLLGADLSGANLSGATGWTPGQLQQARELWGATMPDGTRYEEWIEKQKIS